MPVLMQQQPRRPGYTAGLEETVWEGRPSLRCTIHLWALSIAIAWFLSIFWDMAMSGMVRSGFFSSLPPVIAQSLFSRTGTPSIGLTLLPWIFCLLPVFSYSVQLFATTYRLTTQRLHITTGIFVRLHDQIELFRVRDFLIDAPLYLALMGVRHLRIISRDESLPVVTLIAQKDAYALIDEIRKNVQQRKDEVGMREIETNAI